MFLGPASYHLHGFRIGNISAGTLPLCFFQYMVQMLWDSSLVEESPPVFLHITNTFSLVHCIENRLKCIENLTVRVHDTSERLDLIGGIIVVGDPGIEPGVRLREGVTVPCHTLRPVAHCHAHCV